MPEAGFPRRVILGEAADQAVASVIGYYGAGRVLVLTDRGVASTGIPGRIASKLRESGVEVEIYDGIEPEPDVGSVRSLAERYRGSGVDAIIAVGGGSVIDASKALALLLANPEADPTALAPFQPAGLEGRGPLLVAVPTTAGTGSDWSYALVLTVEEGGERRKEPAANFELVPHVVVLDPRIPSRAPRRIAAGAAADALGHAVEAYVAAGSNALSDALAEHAVRLVFRSASKAIVEGRLDAWAELQVAASLAGAAFSSSGLGLVHAIAHPLGAMLGIHHGTAVGLILPHVVKYYYQKAPEVRGKLERLRLTLEAAEGLPGRPTLYHHIVELFKEIGQPYTATQLGVGRRELDEVSARVAEEALHDPDMAFAPLIPDVEEIAGIVKGLADDPLRG